LRANGVAAHFSQMDEKPTEMNSSAPSLEEAVRRARVDAAEQAGATSSLREADLARLSILEDALRPVIDQAPREADLFDFGKSYGEQPRLFLDMIAFIELAPDRRTYRFFQDTRYGRILIAESARVEIVVVAVTNYVARRLVERERALASDWRSAALAPAKTNTPRPPRAPTTGTSQRSGGARIVAFVKDVLNAFFIGLGALVLISLIAVGAYFAWAEWGRALWSAYIGAPF
jgi:hypothetical protein